MVVPMQGAQFEVLLKCGAQDLDGAVILRCGYGVRRLSHWRSIIVVICSGVIPQIDIVGYILHVKLQPGSCQVQVDVTAKVRSATSILE